MEEALQEQVLALQQQLAARDAEVAALKQREPSTTQPAGQSLRTAEPGPSPAEEKKKVPSLQVGLGAFWKIPMTRTIGASQYQQPCPDADRGTVKMYGKQKEMAIPSMPTGSGPEQLSRCSFPLCENKDMTPHGLALHRKSCPYNPRVQM